MKIQELRIGNYVKGTFTDFCEDEAPQNECVCEIVILDETAQSGFTKWANSIEEKGKFVEEWDRLDGLILNEEWLLKFGKIEWLYKDIDGFFYWFNGEKKYLKFVHSLQNIYFCIEQKELL